MAMRSNYSERFKQRAVEKALNRDKGASISSIARDIGISKSALSLWIKKSGGSSETSFSHCPEKRPQDWSAEEKLNAIIESGNLEAEKLSAYCRNRGIYPHHLEQWRSDIMSSNTSKNNSENNKLRTENHKLKKELRRKEKALAEAAALIVLQKKLEVLWEDAEEEI
jgi:transposase-like protein